MSSTATPYYQQGSYPQPLVVRGTYVAPDRGTAKHSKDSQSGVYVNSNAARLYDEGLTVTDLKPDAPAGRPCRDVFWGLLFYAHIFLLAGLAFLFTPTMIQDVAEGVEQGGQRMMRMLEERNYGNENDESGISPAALVVSLCLSSVYALGVSTLALGFMMSFAEVLIKLALFFNIAFFGVLATFSFLGGAIGAALMCLLMSAFSAYYAYRVWDRIPFAAANLVTAVTAVRANMGLAFYAYLSLVILFGWSIFWAISSVSTMYVLGGCNPQLECQNEVGASIIFLFLISYYWTIQVISNVVHVTTSGTVGTWWMVPEEANGCCSQAVRDSYYRSMTTSFGSICLGSLIVAILQAIKETLHHAREEHGSALACCAECIIGCVESLMEYFNKWAFVYVGLYGFSFVEAGGNVMKLFRERGWTSIITDYMIDTVLFMVSLGIAILVGVLAMFTSAFQGGNDGGTLGLSFVIGFIVGYSMCTTLFSVVSSAVNTVIVCYAEAPNEFQANHQELSNNMRDAWRRTWPNEFNY
ncbi:hypothetical protein FisN_1Hh676 [Fistulifera solaris]|uniref:Choline transporter-like protein n=1 Tax=Fistulifera solaris TaxID=1519565 RepID=A0A1Z5JMP0_FISSO|nr:hypothetical protein FisN_1Hh676 [Fistulifera solaris]|eukprot:GAX15239.1 hypothetical protein FisN_1Hh676 [Fistulifera solaris]